MQAVIMVAGKSTRTYPLTLTRPKPLLPILNTPLIFYNLDQLTGLVDEVVLIVGYKKEMIEQLVGSNYKGMKITYQEQKEQLGTGHAVLQAKQHINDRFVVMNGDDLFARIDIEKMMSYPYAALAIEVENPAEYGVIETNHKGELINLVEKPKTYVSNLANVGCYVFEPHIFEVLEQTPLSERGEIEITSAILILSNQQPIQVFGLEGYWLPTGFPWDLLRTQKYMFENTDFKQKIEGEIIDNAKINGIVQIGKNSKIYSGAQIFGPAIIGDNCHIGPLSYIGPNTTLGNNVELGANCVVEESVIMSDSEIGSGSILRYSIIGSEVHIGEGCHLISTRPDLQPIESEVKKKMVNTNMKYLGVTIADKVKLGAKSWIAPGCKIYPEMQFPIGSTIEKDIIE